MAERQFVINQQLENLCHLISHQNAAIDLLASDKKAALTSDVSEIAELIRNDELLELMDYGDQMILPWKDGNAAEITAPLNLCHSETAELEDGETIPVADFEWNYVLPFDTVYDAPEAIYQAPSGGLAAGTYFFKIVNDSWGGNNDKYINFTLTSDLPEGYQIRKSVGYNQLVTNGTLDVYSSGASLTKEYSLTPTEGQTGTSLGQTDGTGDLNHWQRVALGYNRWKCSAVRQFLNSTATAGNWWTPQNKWDVKPAYADSKDGFLHGYSEDILHYIRETKVITAQNTVTEDGSMDTTFDRVFLVSLEQSYINPQIQGEGSYWEYYKRLLGRTTPAAQYGTYARLIKYDVNARTTARNRWLRSAIRGYAYGVWLVTASGGVSYNNANNGNRCAPCLRIG